MSNKIHIDPSKGMFREGFFIYGGLILVLLIAWLHVKPQAAHVTSPSPSPKVSLTPEQAAARQAELQKEAAAQKAEIASEAAAADKAAADKKAQTAELDQHAEASVQKAVSLGLIQKIDIDSNDVYVDPSLWAGINIDAKQGFAQTLAYYIGRKKGNDLYYADIYDYYSGGKVASYSSWGFKTY